jgi:tripartite ATP-independent transporter DctM subunit
MSPELLGGLMLALMIFVIFVGFPIAFTLLLLALVFGYIGLGDTVFYLMVFQTIGLMKEEVLAAVPLFIFMGYITERAGLMERLFRVLQLLMAPLRGSLYIAVILTATVFAMATGIVGAAVTVLGIMAAPIMIKSGYSPSLSAGAIAAGGTLGILIPPSVMIIVMAPVLGVSVVKLYAAAIGPGFLLAALYMIYTLIRSYLDPKVGPPVPLADRAKSFAELGKAVVVGVVPLALLIACTLGSILAGLATPTEAASVGATGAIVLGFAYRRLTLAGIKSAAISTLTTSSMVLFLAVASNVFGAVFARLGTATVITNTLLAMPVAPFVMLLIVMALIFLLGWPFEWPAIVLVFLPIFYPVIAGLKYDPVWFGALIAVNLQTAFLSPPVAMSAYYLRSVVPQWELGTIYRGMADFMVIQIICLVLVILFPQIALWFPNWLFGP